MAIAAMMVNTLDICCEVHRADSSTEALAMVDRIKPHLTLLDVMMPGLDVCSTVLRLRRLPWLKCIALVLLTAKRGPMDVVKGFQSGARLYLAKPFKLYEMLAKVKKAPRE